jgi:uncharacterized repeat protein (TIGR04076 family)
MEESDQVDDSVWRAVQERLEYTDAQLETFKKRAFSRKILSPETIEKLLRTNVVFEVVESRSCNIGHKVGDQFPFNAEGYLLAHRCPEKICPFIMPVMTRMMWLVMERIYEGVDPRPTFYFGDCEDVGVECGGLGKVRLETKIVYDAV